MQNPQLDRRRFLALGSGLAAAMGLAACGSNNGRSEGSGPASSAGSSGGSGGGGGTPSLSQWYHQYGETGTQQAVEKYAAAYDKAEVSVQWTPGDYDKKAAAALLTGNGPDVFEYGNGATLDMIRGGQVVDLTDLLGDAKDDFTPSLIERMTYEGKLYAIPQVTDMQLLVYRKSLLEKAGVQPPKTLDELIDAAHTLTTKKAKGLFVGNDGGVGVLPGPLLWASGADYLDDSDAPGFTTPEVAQGFAKLHSLFTSGSLLLGAPTDWSDPSAISQGLTAMQWTGLWTVPALQKSLGDDFGVLPFPANGSGGKPAVPVGAYGSLVNAKSKDVEAAKAYVKWLWVDNTQAQEDWATGYGFHIPARKSLAEKSTKLQTGVAADAVSFVNDYGHAQTPLLWTPASSTAFGDATSRIIKDGSDPAKQLAGVATKVKSEISRVKS
ncbi:multiple sugar transport system substrate-binding protein [Motilibacter peucedani]|uniref:Multiple sugar transport system substrate-binding protein n=1 Tax=Motilibacter peucedani TaxID=598650 RepID=A0A420XK33_9ACTN|nr:sugar ABC transporter substrate-binding protein [Motilibacter peucedani]RKS68482.1 multiple sugar transport system substrate-binding protein [Motilibacter peucedani]